MSLQNKAKRQALSKSGRFANIETQRLYHRKLKPRLQKLESQRRTVLLLTVVQVVIAIICALAIWQASPHVFTIIAISLPSLLFLYIFTNGRKHQYVAEYKHSVVQAIVRHVNPDYKYRAIGCVPAQAFTASGLFPQPFDRYSGDDLVTGLIGQTDFEFSELHTQIKKESPNARGETSASWETLFRGLFMHADFNKKLTTATYVVPKGGYLLGRLQHRRSSDNCRPVKLENTEFERMFQVMSFDQIEARYVLTPKIMQAMVDIKRSLPNNQFYFAFLGQRMYCAVKFNRQMFEPAIFRSGLNLGDVELMVKALALIKLVVEEMDLNTRIWTKR